MYFSDRRVRWRATRARARARWRAWLSRRRWPWGSRRPRGPAEAAPLDDPFVGGLSFTGPTSGNLGAVYWNPAALGLVRGFQIMVAGTAQLSTIDVQRASIDPDDRHARRPWRDRHGARRTALPRPSLFGPRSYLAISSDLGGDRFTLAFATYMPWVEQVDFPLSRGAATSRPATTR